MCVSQELQLSPVSIIPPVPITLLFHSYTINSIEPWHLTVSLNKTHKKTMKICYENFNFSAYKFTATITFDEAQSKFPQKCSSYRKRSQLVYTIIRCFRKLATHYSIFWQ